MHKPTNRFLFINLSRRTKLEVGYGNNVTVAPSPHRSRFTIPAPILILVPRLSQADSAAFADDYAYGNVSRVAGYARRRYRRRTRRSAPTSLQAALTIHTP